MRSPGASVEAAKEVKITRLHTFLIERYKALAGDIYLSNRALAIRRATWGGLFTAVGTVGYYAAYPLPRLANDRDLRDYDLVELHARVGVIFQDIVRYHMTAGENIAIGRIEARHDQVRIAAAARDGLAEDVIARLPLGYDQLIGRRFRTGVDLSGGEWQKIAIARAYMREADVLILDEPTAALDARAEAEIFRHFAELSRGKTAVLISHRFSTVRRADRILVLVGGEVEAAGTHDELMAQGGRYAELFTLQAAGFQ